VTTDFRLSTLLPQLLEPRTLLLVGANLLPVLGVVLMGWDTFLLIMLYWLETAVIGFWTFIGILRASSASLSDFKGNAGNAIAPLALGLFIMVHAGIFMGVHFMFVWAIFGSAWAARVNGPVEFFTVMVLPTGLWVPLVALFVTRGLTLLSTPRQHLDGKLVIVGLYVRIVVLHLTIIFGAMLSLLIHSVIGLILLVLLKTAADIAMGPLLDRVQAAMAKAERDAQRVWRE
jgi:hypothetical protein